MAHGSKKEDKQDQAIAALVSHTSVPAAAKACGLSPNTLHSWMKDPAFCAKLSQAKDEILKHAMLIVAQGLVAGATVLRSIALDANAPASARVAAARHLFDLTLREQEIRLLEARILVLEERLNAYAAAS